MAVQTPKKSSALPWPALVPLGHHAGKPPISLQKMVILVGSRHNAHLHLLSRHVSKAHALVLSFGGSVYIRDLASREKVYINGGAEREAWLNNGDLIKIGSFTFKFKEGPTRAGEPSDDAPTDRADLEIDGADAPLAISEKVMLIGRRATCDVSLLEASVSTAHAVIFHVGGKRYVRDLGSRTGTYVNGQRIHQKELQPGDAIRIGETDMRYALAARHARHIEPVEEVASTTAGGELDELEHLVGTAPLDMAAEMRRAEPTAQELEQELQAMAGATEPTDEPAAGDDDLIELELAAPEPAAKIATPKAAVPKPPPVPLEEPPAPIVAAAPPLPAPPVSEPEFAEIDLSTDPDVADLPPSAADTRALGLELEPAAPPRPTISDRIVDQPIDVSSSATADQPGEHVLMDRDLAKQRLSSSATGAELGAAQHEALEMAGEAPADAVAPLPLDQTSTPPGDQTPIEPGDDQAISPRGGWQGMSRVDDVAPLDFAGVAPEPAPDDAALPQTRAETNEGLIDAAGAVTPFPADEFASPDQPPLEIAEAPVEQLLPEITTPVFDDNEVALPLELPAAPTPVVPEPAPAVSADISEVSFDESAIAPVPDEPTMTAPPTAEAHEEIELPIDEGPIAEPPVADVSPIEAPVAELPVTEAPAIDENSLVEPTLADPPPVEAFAETPIVELPVVEAPAIETPVAEAPAFEAPPADVPSVEAVAAAALPALEAPALEAPVLETPAVADAPAAPEAVVEAPAKKGRGRKGKTAEPKEDKPKRGRRSKKSDTLAASSAESATPVEDARTAEVLAPFIAADAAATEIAGETAAAANEAPADEEIALTEPADPNATLNVARTAAPQSVADVPPTEQAPISPTDQAIVPPTIEPAVEPIVEPFAMEPAPTAAPAEPQLEDTQPPTDTSHPLNSASPAVDASEIVSAALAMEESIEATEAPAAAPADTLSMAIAGDLESPVVADQVSVSSSEIEGTAPVIEAQTTAPEPSIEVPAQDTPAETTENLTAENLDTLPDVTPNNIAAPAESDPLEQLEPVQELPADDDQAVRPQAEEELEEVAVVEDDQTPADPPRDARGAADEPDPLAIFGGGEDSLDVLDLTSADLKPAISSRDPDALLALDQVNAEELDSVEVIEPTEPTPESALNLGVTADESVAAPSTPESLTDSTFGRQVEAFTAGTSSGELVEDLPEVEEVPDPDEALALALDAAGAAGDREPTTHDARSTPPDDHDALNLEELEPIGQPIDEPEDSSAVIGGAIEPSELGVVTEENLAVEQFEALGESLELETPGVAEADAVLGEQAFAAEGDAQEIGHASAEPLADQSFFAEADEASTHEVTAPTTPVAPAPAHPIAEAPAPVGAASPATPPPPPGRPGAQRPVDQGFVIGTDLSSFIGGMPLVLPDVAPPPSGFGQVQVSFAGAKAPWQQARRPAFPMGQSLAQEMMEAAQGLRDVEEMDAAEVQEETDPAQADDYGASDEESITDDGAPGDEWNVAAVLDGDEEPIAADWAHLNEAAATPHDASSTTTTTHAEAPAEDDVTAGMEPEPASEPVAGDPQATANELATQAQALDEPEAIDEESLAPSDEEVPFAQDVPEPPSDEPEPIEAAADDQAAHDDDLTEIDSLDSFQPQVSHEFDESDLVNDGQGEPAPAADQSLNISADETACFPPPELPVSITQEADQAAPPVDDESVETAEQDDLTEIDPESASGFVVEELNFDEPSGLEDIEPQESSGPPRTGAIEEAVADLHFDEPQTEESVVDRSPPPPVIPPPRPGAKQGKQQPPAAAPAMTPRMPPPPARSLQSRRAGQQTPVTNDASAADAVFGSLEHGKAVGGAAAAAGAAFANAAGGVREMDVFATPSTDLAEMEREMGPADASDFGTDAADAPAPRARGGRGLVATDQDGANGDGGRVAGSRGSRLQRAIVPPRMGAVANAAAGGFGGGDVAVAPNAAGAPRLPVYKSARRKSAASRVLWIVLLMLVSMGAAIGGICYFMKVKQTSIGELHFQNVGALTKLQRDQLRDEQFTKLNSSPVRFNARTYVAAKGIDPGALAIAQSETDRFVRTVQAEWPEDRPSTMTIRYVGSDAHDKDRVYALMLAMYEENHDKEDRRIRLKSEVQQLEKKIRETEELRGKRATLAKQVEAAPTDESLRQLEAQLKEADSAYDVATAALKDAQLELRRAEEQLPLSPGEAALAASQAHDATAAAPAAPTDPELARLQKSLDDAAAKTAALKGAASEEADAKRKMLDQAVEAFQHTAASLVSQNPQLAQYVQAVQQLQERTHKLGGDLIEVQLEQHKRLSALKKDMDEQVQARKNEIWASDKGLSDLRAQYDLAQRKINAAKDQGFSDDSREVRDALADKSRLEGLVESRKKLLGDDPIVAKVTAALGELIKLTQERLDADRARIEKDIKDQEQAFAQAGMLERLPEQQQAQAKALDEKQRAIGELRKQYAQALDRRTAESNAALRSLEDQVTRLSGQIDERKHFLAAQNAKGLTQQQEAQRRAVVEQKQAALKRTQEQAAAAQKTYAERSRAVRDAVATRADVAAARQELEAIDQTLSGKDEETRLDKLALEQRNEQLKKLVPVAKPAEGDIQVFAGRDDKLLYSMGAVIGLLVLFGIITVVSVSGGGEGRGRRSAQFTDEDEDAFASRPGADAGPMAIHQIGAARQTDRAREAPQAHVF
ncbi:MAG TPA: FHA domain-containing protein [Tepidisphaeraceae bacterium]